MRTLGDRNLRRSKAVRILVRGPPDRDVGESRAQQVDLIEVELARRGRVDRHTVHDREVDTAVLKEAVEVVDLGQIHAAGGYDHGQARMRDLFDERPVRGRAARDFYDVEAHVDDDVDGLLVERRAHCRHLLPADLAEELLEVRALDPRGDEAANMLVVTLLDVPPVDEGIELPELELHRRASLVFLGQLAHCADNVACVLDAALMIVGEIEHD